MSRPLEINGRMFLLHGQQVFLSLVTYGPFPPGQEIDHERELGRIKKLGFHGVRVYSFPTHVFLEKAREIGLIVISAAEWESYRHFREVPRYLSEGRARLRAFLEDLGEHPALGAVLIGNEIPSDLVRVIGVDRVKESLEGLIDLVHEVAPGLPAAYGNYPTTEYLELAPADFTAMNIYLEAEQDFRSYLRKLPHLSGDRPVLISEIGMDSNQHGEKKQGEVLDWMWQAAQESGLSGATVYSWSDLWWNQERLMQEWAFGINDAVFAPKEALATMLEKLAQPWPPQALRERFFSILICSRNGHTYLKSCLAACLAQQYSNYEIILVDDGSEERLESLVPDDVKVRYYYQEGQGLSVARNTAAHFAKGEILAYTDDDCEPDPHWLFWLNRAYQEELYDAIGGPNLSPVTEDRGKKLVQSLPAHATHVMLDDQEAEHLPGCNLSVKKEAFESIGGFDPIFKAAGDDVDFCWRLRERGMKLGFHPAAFVWHHRRASLSGYLKQQMGYGRAEALLYQKHPEQFGEGGIKWQGSVYSGVPRLWRYGARVYHGFYSQEAYQGLLDFEQGEGLLEKASWRDRCLYRWISWLQPWLRAKARYQGGGRLALPLRRLRSISRSRPVFESEILAFWDQSGILREEFIEEWVQQGWAPSGEADLVANGVRLFVANEQGKNPFFWVRIESANGAHMEVSRELIAFAKGKGWHLGVS